MVGGSGPAIRVPFRVDPLDPLDPLDPVNSRENSGQNRSFFAIGVAKVKILSLMLLGKHYFFCFSCSVRVDILIFETPLR